MNALERLARDYRQRAQQLRAIAAVDCSEKRRKELSQIASDFDLRASFADAILRTYHASGIECTYQADAIQRSYDQHLIAN